MAQKRQTLAHNFSTIERKRQPTHAKKKGLWEDGNGIGAVKRARLELLCAAIIICTEFGGQVFVLSTSSALYYCRCIRIWSFFYIKLLLDIIFFSSLHIYST